MAFVPPSEFNEVTHRPPPALRLQLPSRRHLLFLTGALLCTVGLMIAVWQTFDAESAYQPPDIVYVEQWSANRTDAEVHARLAADAPRERAERAAAEAAALKRQQQFGRVAKTLGFE